MRSEERAERFETVSRECDCIAHSNREVNCGGDSLLDVGSWAQPKPEQVENTRELLRELELEDLSDIDAYLGVKDGSISKLVSQCQGSGLALLKTDADYLAAICAQAARILIGFEPPSKAFNHDVSESDAHWGVRDAWKLLGYPKLNNEPDLGHVQAAREQQLA